MCGISGIINLDKTKVCEEKIKIINDLISHRGPDDEGFYFNSNFAFGHRRLSIIDLSSDGHQPMHYLDKYTITYNGEIYNYIEIREELLKFGYSFNSLSDTEVILASYDKWGENCVQKFNGMWAFSIHDKEKKVIFCSRDRFGIKPFYYTRTSKEFVFGSEIKQLLTFYQDNYVNVDILMDYLIVGFEEHTNETFFQNIFKLEQSHNLTFYLETNKYEINRYYDIKHDKSLQKLNKEETVQVYGENLKKAIKLRLRSDVKVGTCLSGGLDSSSITAIASIEYFKASGNKLTAIHAKSTQQSTDESKYAEYCAKKCNVNLHIIEPSTDDFIKNIDELVYTQEEPFGGISLFMQYFVMKLAKKLGCKVMLDGQGGDETLLGYERYYPAYLMNFSFFDRIKYIRKSSKNSKLSFKQLVFYYVYFTNSTIRQKHLKKKNKFIKEEYFNRINKELIKKNSNNYLNIYNLQYGEIYSTQMPHLLKYEDKNSMRNSIETRLPFIDYELLETAVSLNDSFKIHNGWTKYILRKSMDKILPKKITWRKNKLGFEGPSKEWFDCLQDDMNIMIKKSAIINHITKKEIDFNRINTTQKWKLYNIAKWEDIFNVKIN